MREWNQLWNSDQQHGESEWEPDTTSTEGFVEGSAAPLLKPLLRAVGGVREGVLRYLVAWATDGATSEGISSECHPTSVAINQYHPDHKPGDLMSACDSSLASPRAHHRCLPAVSVGSPVLFFAHW